MLRVFKDLFDSVLVQPREQSEAERLAQLQLAAAVLLVEVMRADADSGPAQQQTRDLVALAEERSRAANDFFQFTSVINDGFEQDEKVRMVESLWRVAYADGVLDAQQNHVISRLAELLHVPHGQYIAAKMHAQEQGG